MAQYRWVGPGLGSSINLGFLSSFGIFSAVLIRLSSYF
jgi:hypothetical protein